MSEVKPKKVYLHKLPKASVNKITNLTDIKVRVRKSTRKITSYKPPSI